MIRQVADDLYQIGEHVVTEHGHEAIHIYVLLNEGAPILIDCGSHLHREPIMRELTELVGDGVPSHIFLTHSELPHAGNIAAINERWPDIQVIVSNVMLPYIEVLPVIPLKNITQVTPGTVIELPTRRLEFVDALLKDQPGSQWIYDSRTKALFTGDGFGYFNSAENIAKFSDEVDGGVSAEQFTHYHQIAFRFLQWTKPHRLNPDLDKMFAGRDIDIVAPIHGSAIRSDIGTHVSRVKQAIETVHNSYW